MPSLRPSWRAAAVLCQARQCSARWASTSTPAATPARALVYSERGEPSNVLRGLSFELRPPRDDEIRIRFLMSPQNPADLNVIQGSYPERPKAREELSDASQQIYIGGNEGLAVVEHVPQGGNGTTSLQPGDWVIMGRPQLGTWATHANVPASSLFPVPRSSGLSEVQAATLSINPGTAYRMLKDFVPVRRGDWIVQNGGNSQVGLAVIQLAREWGIKTINFVRDRDDIQSLRNQLRGLGADHVVMYSELADKSFKAQLQEMTDGSPLQLGLNCVGGKDTANMAKLLGKDATLVTYGAMSMQPLSLPSSLFIFKNLTSKGFWLTTWYKACSFDERMAMTKELVALMEAGKLRAPECEIVDLSGSDEQVGRRAREAIAETRGKKVVFRFVD